MSLRSRARALQHATGISYQTALERIRALGKAPAELARKTGWPLKVCDAYLLDRERRPSVRVEPQTRARTLSGLCEELRVTSAARAVCIVDAKGRWLAMSGLDAVRLAALPREMRNASREPESVVLDAAGGIHVFSRALATGARLIVLFDDESSLGLVRLRARAAAIEIDKLLDMPMIPPPRGDSGNSAPAQISAFDGLFDRLGKLGGSKPS